LKYRENEKNEKNTSDPKQGQKFWILSMRLCFGKLLTLFAVRSLYNLNIWLSLQTNDFIDRNILTDSGDVYNSTDYQDMICCQHLSQMERKTKPVIAKPLKYLRQL
jgi:hypothetical protein